MGANTAKTHPKFRRKKGKSFCCHLHAEMNVLRFSRPGDRIVVLRFTSDGELTMAMPCEHCQHFIEQHQISKVVYSDWNGDLQTL